MKKNKLIKKIILIILTLMIGYYATVTTILVKDMKENNLINNVK